VREGLCGCYLKLQQRGILVDGVISGTVANVSERSLECGITVYRSPKMMLQVSSLLALLAMVRNTLPTKDQISNIAGMPKALRCSNVVVS
jgi:hypothetical protein